MEKKRLTWKRSIDGCEDVGLCDGVTVGDAICKLADLEERNAVEAASTWIPTATQKPKKNGEYIVWIVGASQATSLWYDPEEDEWFGSDDSGVIYPVSHWMPLPELPKEAKG